jgi:hypothetical protein
MVEAAGIEGVHQEQGCKSEDCGGLVQPPHEKNNPCNVKLHVEDCAAHGDDGW